MVKFRKKNPYRYCQYALRQNAEEECPRPMAPTDLQKRLIELLKTHTWNEAVKIIKEEKKRREAEKVSTFLHNV